LVRFVFGCGKPTSFKATRLAWSGWESVRDGVRKRPILTTGLCNWDLLLIEEETLKGKIPSRFRFFVNHFLSYSTRLGQTWRYVNSKQ
jgi:hypothetical protein